MSCISYLCRYVSLCLSILNRFFLESHILNILFILTREAGKVWVQVYFVQDGGVGQVEGEGEGGVVHAEEVVGPGGGPHAAGGTHARPRATPTTQQHVRRLSGRVAAGDGAWNIIITLSSSLSFIQVFG